MLLGLLLITIHSYGGNVAKPLFCSCFTNTSDPVGSNYPCNTPNCSRGNNPHCSGLDFSGRYPHHRVFQFYGVITIVGPYAYFGYNCPGFSFNRGLNGTNGYLIILAPGEKNQIENYGSNLFNYSYCSDFSDSDLDLSACCCFCCGPDPPHNTNSGD